MSRYRFVITVGVAFALTSMPVEGQSGGDEGEKTVIELQQAEDRREVPPPMIGLEAFREVLASGRYIVGPGDEFFIFMTGMEEPLPSVVLAEGGLFIPFVGMVQVGGLRLKDAHAAIDSSFRKSVKVGDINIELSEPRTFPVPVVGLVEEPGILQASGVERVTEIINKAGGLEETASMRNIMVYKTAFLDAESQAQLYSQARSGNLAGAQDVGSYRVDITMYEATGLSRYNPFIEDGDIVVVPASQGQIGAREAVQFPDFFEFVEGDRISDLLTIAMGPSPYYDPEHVYLFRYGDDKTTMDSLPVDIEGVQAGDRAADILLQPDDWLVVRGIPGYHERSTISIVGEVRYPGYHVVDRGQTDLKTVILTRAGGFTDDAALPEARVVRLSYDEREEEDTDRWYDWIRFIPVADRTDDQDQYFNMKTRERAGHMVVDFVALFEGGDESQNIVLRPGDIIIVPRRQQTVVVSGQAAAPGAVVYNKDYSVWDYIERAGGYGWRASKDVRVIKARTGEMRSAESIVQIDPGDRIWIKEKPVRDYWEIFTQSMNVIGQVTTVVLLYVTITRN